MLKPVLGSQLQLGHPLAKGLVGCWLMNEGSGDKVFDLSGSSNHGTFNGNCTWKAGQFGSCVDFPGNLGDYVNGISPVINKPFTHSFWCYPRSVASNQGIVAYQGGYNVSGGFGTLILTNQKFYTHIRTSAGYKDISYTVPSLNKWYFVTTVWDGTNISIYINGIFSASGARGGTLTRLETTFEFGYEDYGDYDEFDGLIDNIYLYNRALSAAEVASLYLNPFQMFQRRPIELWTAATSVGGISETVYPDTLALALTQQTPTVVLPSYTKLLLHLNGGDGTQETCDSSDSDHTIGFGGTAQLDTAQKKFELSSLLLDGNSDYLTVADHTDWDFGAGDFTLDKWIRFNSLPAAGNYMSLIYRWLTGDDNRCFLWTIYNDAGTYKFQFAYSVNGISQNTISSNALTFVIDTWYHIAVVRDGNTLRFFLDGVAKGTGDLTGITLYDATGGITIGSHSMGGSFFDGWLDEIRISKVIARWTSNFTPPTAEYPNDFTHSATTLALALTQQTPTVFDIITVTPSTFALAMTLQTPDIIAGQIITPDTFALALSQQTPAVLFPEQTILPSTLALALTQQAPTIIKNTLSWSAGLLTYKGVTYEISAGVTQKKFVYWDPNYTTVFKTTDDLQDVFDVDGWIMCLNESGVAYPAFARKLIHGGIIQAGTITAAYGQIADATVGTLQIIDHAVIDGADFWGNSSVTIPSAESRELAQVTYECTGYGKIFIQFAATAYSATLGIFDLTVKRGANVLYTIENLSSTSSPYRTLWSLQFSDTPSAAEHVYSIHVYNQGASTSYVQKRSLHVHEFKR